MREYTPRMTGEIAVTLTPALAKHVADTIRIQLLNRWDSEWLTSLPGREEVGQARSLLDVYSEELEELEWGESAGSVQLHGSRKRLLDLAANLAEGAEECLADPDCQRGTGRFARRHGQDMSAAAEAIRDAVQ